MTSVVDRFIKYAKVYTTSEYDTGTFPSTARQFDLAKMLVKEMKEMGLQDVELDGKGYIYATLPANTPEKIPTIGLVAHMDTSPEAPGENVSPQIVRNYDGGEIVLNKKLNMVLSPRDFPELLKYVGQDIITADGTTLLGADDKAGIAVILSAMEYLIQHPESKHGRIRIGFTPDEEIGHGADFFDVNKFNADFAYTVDGGELGELEYECFNACMAKVHIQGRSVHPGSAKNQMINAIELAYRFHGLLPAAERPEYTEKYEGFYHLYQVNAEVEEATLIYIIRDHDRNIYEKRKAVFMKAVDYVNQVAGTDRVKVDLIEQYQNMKEVILPKMHVVDTAKQAMEELEIKPKIGPIRGGTDGARLSYQGLPTPNLFAGGHNFHGKYEYLPIPSLEKSVQVVLKVLSLYTENPKF
jgi:tripeptide aminopeptidase